jgi:hypothetical protein
MRLGTKVPINHSSLEICSIKFKKTEVFGREYGDLKVLSSKVSLVAVSVAHLSSDKRNTRNKKMAVSSVTSTTPAQDEQSKIVSNYILTKQTCS